LRALTSLLLMIAVVSLSGCSLNRKSDKPQTNLSTNTSTAQPNDNRGSESSQPSGHDAQKQSTDTVTAANDVADELHTPERGSLEREGMMDSLRAAFDDRSSGYYTPHRGNIVFIVDYLKAHNGWAWTFAYPTSSDKSDTFGEYSGFLLHQEGGRWKLMKLPPMVKDPNDPENLDYPSRKDVEKIREQYPNAPADIFPSR
jgi:hypothetical protein